MTKKKTTAAVNAQCTFMVSENPATDGVTIIRPPLRVMDAIVGAPAESKEEWLDRIEEYIVANLPSHRTYKRSGMPTNIVYALHIDVDNISSTREFVVTGKTIGKIKLDEKSDEAISIAISAIRAAYHDMKSHVKFSKYLPKD